MHYQKSFVINILYFLFFFLILLCAESAYAKVPDAQTMIINLSKVMPKLTKLVTALSFVMGMGLVAKGIIGMKHIGEMRTMASRDHSLKGPLIYLFVGAALLYLPSTIQAGLSTFWANPAPYGYRTEVHGTWAELTKAVFSVIQLVGGIAFIRGLLMLSHLGEHAQQGTFGKAMAHIIGGIFCINMYQFVQVITNTLYLGQV